MPLHLILHMQSKTEKFPPETMDEAMGDDAIQQVLEMLKLLKNKLGRGGLWQV